ncbi:MAG: hypothetical protein KAS07_05700 [Candidatus Pacebacteria bacterium]|nr:hypothetical protein [Candidatus Paceibacterota bacterium]
MFEQPKSQEKPEEQINTSEINRDPAAEQADIDVAEKHRKAMRVLESSTLESLDNSRV